MKLGSRETFQNLKHRTGLDKSQYFQPRKYTTLRNVKLEASGVLARKRHDYVKLFKAFTQAVVPAMERRVEYELMKHQFRQIEDETVKKSLAQGYLRRLTQLREIEIRAGEIKGHPPEPDAVLPEVNQNVYVTTPFKFVGVNEIGGFVKFTLPEFKKYFKYLAPGDFGKELVLYNKTFAVQLTEEGVKLIDYMRNQIKDENVYKRLLNANNLKEAVYDEQVFQRLFASIRVDLWQQFDKFRKDTQIHRLFVNSPVFDSLVSTIVKEISENKELLVALSDTNKRLAIFNSIADQIKEKLDPEQLNSQLPYLFHKTVKTLKLGDHNVDLLPYQEQPFHTPESFAKYRFPDFVNCGNTMLAYGKQGTGKSGIIMQASMWAAKSGWVVITVPSGYKWTQEISDDFERHHETGLYLQPKFASEFLDQIGDANKELFQKMEVNLDLWGKYNLSGAHDDDVQAVPNLYDPVRKYYFNEHEQFLEKEEIAAMAEQNVAYDIRLSRKILPQPKNLYDIVEAARANPIYATSAIYEIMEQLYKQDKFPLLVAVDGMNWFYRPSSYPSFRYDSDRGLKGTVPPYHLSLCRAFMHLDGHKIRNGYKVLSTQIWPFQGHVFTPDMIHYPMNYCVEIGGLPLDHYRLFCHFWTQNKAWAGDDRQQQDIEQFWMETQGNLGETTRLMRTNWRALV